MTSDGFGAAKGKKCAQSQGFGLSGTGPEGGGMLLATTANPRAFGRGASFVGRPSHSQHSAWATIAVQVDATVELMELRLKV